MFIRSFLWKFVIPLGWISCIFCADRKLVDLTRVEIVLEGVSYRCIWNDAKASTAVFYNMLNNNMDGIKTIDGKFKDNRGKTLRTSLTALKYNCAAIILVEVNGQKMKVINPELFKTDKIDKVILFPFREKGSQVGVIIKDSKGAPVLNKSYQLKCDFEYYKYKVLTMMSSLNEELSSDFLTKATFKHCMFENFFLTILENEYKGADESLLQSYVIDDAEKVFNSDDFLNICDEVSNALASGKNVAFNFVPIKRLDIKYNCVDEECVSKIYTNFGIYLEFSRLHYISKSVGDFRENFRKRFGLDLYLCDASNKILEDNTELTLGSVYNLKFIDNGFQCDLPYCFTDIKFCVDGGEDDVSENIVSLVKSGSMVNGRYAIPNGTKYSCLKKVFEERNPFLGKMEYKLEVGGVPVDRLIVDGNDKYIADNDQIAIVFASDQNDVIESVDKEYVSVELFMPGTTDLEGKECYFNLSVPKGISYNDFVSFLECNLVMKFGEAKCAGLDFSNLNIFVNNECFTHSGDPNAKNFVGGDFKVFLYHNFFEEHHNPNKYDDKKGVKGPCCKCGCCK